MNATETTMTNQEKNVLCSLGIAAAVFVVSFGQLRQFVGDFAVVPAAALTYFAFRYCMKHQFFSGAPKAPPALPSYAQSDALKAFLLNDLSRKADAYHPRSSRPYDTSLPMAMSKVKALISSYSLTVGPQVNRFSITALDQNEGTIQAQLNFQQYVGGSLSSPASVLPSSVIANIWFHVFEEGVIVEQGYQVATTYNVVTPNKVIEDLKNEISTGLNELG